MMERSSESSGSGSSTVRTSCASSGESRRSTPTRTSVLLVPLNVSRRLPTAWTTMGSEMLRCRLMHQSMLSSGSLAARASASTGLRVWAAGSAPGMSLGGTSSVSAAAPSGLRPTIPRTESQRTIGSFLPALMYRAISAVGSAVRAPTIGVSQRRNRSS